MSTPHRYELTIDSEFLPAPVVLCRAATLSQIARTFFSTRRAGLRIDPELFDMTRREEGLSIIRNGRIVTFRVAKLGARKEPDFVEMLERIFIDSTVVDPLPAHQGSRDDDDDNGPIVLDFDQDHPSFPPGTFAGMVSSEESHDGGGSCGREECATTTGMCPDELCSVCNGDLRKSAAVRNQVEFVRPEGRSEEVTAA
jgi:hypothetical protein